LVLLKLKKFVGRKCKIRRILYLSRISKILINLSESDIIDDVGRYGPIK